ncbi:MAG: phage tail protein [Vibrio sp.]
MNKLTMRINGATVPFYSANLDYSMEQLAHTFSCSISPMIITEPLPVEFYLNDALILVGRIDSVELSTDSSSHSVVIAGRSASANMIDSRITTDALYDLTIDKLLRKLAAQFNLEVRCLVSQSSLEPVFEFQINAESPVENIAQVIREQGFVLVERNGVLTIENPAHATIQGIGLEVGNNVEQLGISRHFDKQFHTIEVQGAWDDASASVISSDIDSSRKLVIISDQLQTEAACLSRANYERNAAIASSLTVSSSIAGIFPQLAIDGINRVIRVIDKNQKFNEMLVIKALSLSVSERSMITTVNLSRPWKEQSYV